jgi:hypothetical protein
MSGGEKKCCQLHFTKKLPLLVQTHNSIALLSVEAKYVLQHLLLPIQQTHCRASTMQH